jgi:uncharacterized protein YneF (UPF0154 family)
MEVITHIIIPLIILVGLIYVVGHQYGELQGRYLAKKAAKEELENNKN